MRDLIEQWLDAAEEPLYVHHIENAGLTERVAIEDMQGDAKQPALLLNVKEFYVNDMEFTPDERQEFTTKLSEIELVSDEDGDYTNLHFDEDAEGVTVSGGQTAPKA